MKRWRNDRWNDRLMEKQQKLVIKGYVYNPLYIFIKINKCVKYFCIANLAF